jgi:hypothetical protein
MSADFDRAYWMYAIYCLRDEKRKRRHTVEAAMLRGRLTSAVRRMSPSAVIEGSIHMSVLIATVANCYTRQLPAEELADAMSELSWPTDDANPETPPPSRGETAPRPLKLVGVQ